MGSLKYSSATFVAGLFLCVFDFIKDSQAEAFSCFLLMLLPFCYTFAASFMEMIKVILFLSISYLQANSLFNCIKVFTTKQSFLGDSH
jgi:hypothetical protein